MGFPGASLPGRLLVAMESRAALPAQRFREGAGWRTRTHGEVRDRALRVAGALRARGVGSGDRVGLVADLGPDWLPADLGILALGALDVPRGTETSPPELGEILAHSGARACVVLGEEALRRVRASGAGIPILRLEADLLGGEPADPGSLPATGSGDPATVIYTSGTTGRPKGVTLLHGNFLHQVDVLPAALGPQEGDTFLLTLPPWHAFERIVEYLAAAVGAEAVFAAPRDLREDLLAVRPTWMATVPRVWEMVLAFSGWRKRSERDPEGAAAALRGALGGRLRCAVAGGGLVPAEVDAAYLGSGIDFRVGYGLTETGPVLTVRRSGSNRAGTIGRPIERTEIRILARESAAPLPSGGEGVIHARGPQVMRGYWRDEELTRRALDAEGWFDTGDLGALGPGGDLEFRGRAKDTIVLRGGEKVEPSRLEDRLLGSPLIEQAVVAGSDRKVLGVLLVPRADALERELRRRGGAGPDAAEALLREECARLLTEEAGFAAHERIARVRVLPEPLSVENGLLTATMKVRRAAVLARHAALLAGMFGE